MYIKKILKDLNARAYIAICVLMSCLSFALAAQAFQKNENPYDLRISAPRAVSTQRMRIIENGLRTVPDIDIANHKIFRVVEWHSGSERGTLVAVREGVGRAASCSFFEQAGDAPFAFVTGQPFCGFIDVAVGKAATGLPTIKFGVFIRQSFDSPEDKMDFELLFDSSNNLFCHPDSISEKYKCSISMSNPPAGENDVRGGSEVGFPAVRMLSKFSTSKEALAFKKITGAHIKSDKVFSAIEWKTSTDKGTIVAVHGRSTNTTSCSLFEQTNKYSYQLVIGDPACNFFLSLIKQLGLSSSKYQLVKATTLAECKMNTS